MGSRRSFLAGLMAATTAPSIGWTALGSPSYLAAAKTPHGGFVLVGLNSGGLESFSVPLPARGHAGAAHPRRAEAVIFARRPGQFALVLDCVTGAIIKRLSPAKDREFNGHGVYAGDGAYLFTSEQVSSGSAGRIGVWSTDTYERIGEMDSFGIGPHEIKLSHDKRHIVIANGGIETPPGARAKLNLSTMRPNLSYIDLTGTLVDQVTLKDALRLNSIRHLAVGPQGQVAFGMQWQGDPDTAHPILGLHSLGSGADLCVAPISEAKSMAGYAGSVSFNAAGSRVAVTSPKGGKILVFSSNGAFERSLSRQDVCGLAPHNQGFVASDGFGSLVTFEQKKPALLSQTNLAWDNHMVSI